MARLKQYDEQALIDRSQYGGSTFDQQHFTDDELRAAAQAREAYRTGQTDMKSAHDFVEGIRSKYGYSGGGNGSQYNKISYTQQTNQWNDTINALWDQINGYGPFQDTREKPTYSNRYDQQINDLLQQYVNREKFSYDYKNDPLYANYRKQYQREGQRATQDALAEAAAASGGIPSSYAASAAAQAQNYYASQIADKIPELEQLAYQKYLDDASLQQSKISALQGQEQLDYAKYIDALGQYNTDRNFDYGVYSDRYNQIANNLGLAANQQSTQYSMETAAQGDALDRVQNFLKAGGKLADLDATLIARSGLTPAELKTYEAYYANQPSGGSGGRGGRGGGSGGSEEETTRQTGKGYIDNTYNRGGAGGIQSKTYDQLKRGMYEWIALGRKDKAYELFQGIVHQLNLGNSKGKKQYNELASILNDAGFGIPLE
jgi:hypothetical protein|nr:MAG TPA: PC4 and SFRS1-interacting protein binding, transciptional co-activator, domain.05A [Caudoviricetes sp.]